MQFLLLRRAFVTSFPAGVCCGPCNPSKWEAEFWGWLEVWRPALLCFTVNQRPHWACWQYGFSGGTQGCLGVGERLVWAVGYIQQLKALWNSLVSEHSVGFQIKIGRPKFYVVEMIAPAYEFCTIVIGVLPIFLKCWSPPLYCNKYLLCYKQDLNRIFINTLQ